MALDSCSRPSYSPWSFHCSRARQPLRAARERVLDADERGGLAARGPPAAHAARPPGPRRPPRASSAASRCCSRELRLHGACLAFGPSCRIVAKTLPQLAVLEMRGNELTGTRAPPHTRGAARGRTAHRRRSARAASPSPCALRHILPCAILLPCHTPLPRASPYLVPPPGLFHPLALRCCCACSSSRARRCAPPSSRGTTARRGARRLTAPRACIRACPRRPRAAPRAPQPGRATVCTVRLRPPPAPSPSSCLFGSASRRAYSLELGLERNYPPTALSHRRSTPRRPPPSPPPPPRRRRRGPSPGLASHH